MRKRHLGKFVTVITLSSWALVGQTGCKTFVDEISFGLTLIPISKDVLKSPAGERLFAGAVDDLTGGGTTPALFSIDDFGNVELCDLSLKDAFNFAEACATAADGSIIGFLVDDQFRVKAIRWPFKDQFGVELLGELAEASPTDVTFDGMYIVGASFGDVDEGAFGGPEGGTFVVQATLWAAPDFAPQNLDFLPGGDSFNDALTVTMVNLPTDQEGGATQAPLIGGFALNSLFVDQPVLWLGTSIQEVLSVGSFNGGSVEEVSQNGAYAAGLLLDSSFQTIPAVWHDNDGDYLNYELLPIDTGGQLFDSRATIVLEVPNVPFAEEGPAGDPLFLVMGNGEDASGEPRAFSFDPLNGFRLLDEALTDVLGAELNGMTITQVGGASVDGDGTIHITGQGLNSKGNEEAWAVQIFTQEPGGKDLPGDCDGDNDIDLLDWAEFQLCYTGPGGPVEPGCECSDFDGDDDIDLIDFGTFQLSFTGPM